MKIALLHFRVGETDGVSLEMDKWKIALQKMGHEVVYIAGSKGTTETKTFIVEEIHYKNDRNDRIVRNAYERLVDFTENELKEEIFDYATSIEKKLLKIIDDENIDILIPNNIWSLGWGLSAGIATTNAVKARNLQSIGHNHDFYWEREKYSNPTCRFINSILEDYFLPKEEYIKHCVINSLAQDQLKTRKGIDSIVVPNVFDFSSQQWVKDDYNIDIRERISIKKNDLIFLQATRIVERKGIELAIDYVSEINLKKKELIGKTLYNGETFKYSSNVYLILAGMNEDSSYTEKLIEKAKDKNVNLKFINNIVDHSRTYRANEKVYSLWDIYTEADIVTYPSLLEGWGNQFLEAVFAKIPVLVYEYPVFEKDLLKMNFNVLSLGNSHNIDCNKLAYVDKSIISTKVDETFRLLLDSEYRKEYVESNFSIAKENYSYESLEKILKILL